MYQIYEKIDFIIIFTIYTQFKLNHHLIMGGGNQKSADDKSRPYGIPLGNRLGCYDPILEDQMISKKAKTQATAEGKKGKAPKKAKGK